MRASFRFQALIVTLLIPILILAAFIYEQQSSIFRVRQYVGIWEDDIAEALLVQQDAQLLEKIRSQLVLVVPAVRETQVLRQGNHVSEMISEKIGDEVLKFSSASIPLSLNLNPVGEVYVRLSNQSLLKSALISPIFGLGLLLLMGLSLVSARREFRLEMARLQLAQNLQLEKAFADLAIQVAHDIRSPLMALTTVVGRPGAVDQEVLPLLRGASDRIHRIAEELLEKARPRKNVPNWQEVANLELEKHGNLSKSKRRNLRNESIEGGIVDQNKQESCSVHELQRGLQNLISEFQARFEKIEWTVRLGTSSDRAIPLEFDKVLRMLSNILQNSADAIEGSGKVQMEMFVRASKLYLHIQDSGKGISEEVLQKLLLDGGTFGKINGNGLGLKDVRESLKQVGGKFDLQSREGVGTLSMLEIPLNLP